ncbi:MULTISPECIES: MarR family transcriptional regulator [unclassified Bradyrhizobium]|uniref:MarR family winged helix-turn-helix transcriptional regulator n=1 Tax=unclassified Bradyrhizobium TaxID=2631580 RepID=UPI00247ABFE3|nr:MULTISPECIES: MarR family transcriptional regulator [unclassified Bradyrhizobium]WGR73152.1 MarR family transcriptional regulator [Bradyrhizobium sp. ISRA426]WGR77992.1 MarR family transcriptional regulator [Bradyrhizobium sp. ISRA430]WGR88393.1 MarR family transcriptional regulator [Bradyrhizobium sp. ISRA432]
MVDQSEFDFRLGSLIHDVSRLRRLMFDRALAPLGITRSQWWVLEFIARNDGLPQTRLANGLDLGKVALGTLIDRLEAAGFVIRQIDPADRRVNRVYLTKQALQLLEGIRKNAETFDGAVLRDVHEEELEATSRALLAIKQNLLALCAKTKAEEPVTDRRDCDRRDRQ